METARSAPTQAGAFSVCFSTEKSPHFTSMGNRDLDRCSPFRRFLIRLRSARPAPSLPQQARQRGLDGTFPRQSSKVRFLFANAHSVRQYSSIFDTADANAIFPISITLLSAPSYGICIRIRNSRPFCAVLHSPQLEPGPPTAKHPPISCV